MLFFVLLLHQAVFILFFGHHLIQSQSHWGDWWLRWEGKKPEAKQYWLPGQSGPFLSSLLQFFWATPGVAPIDRPTVDTSPVARQSARPLHACYSPPALSAFISTSQSLRRSARVFEHSRGPKFQMTLSSTQVNFSEISPLSSGQTSAFRVVLRLKTVQS